MNEQNLMQKILMADKHKIDKFTERQRNTNQNEITFNFISLLKIS